MEVERPGSSSWRSQVRGIFHERCLHCLPDRLDVEARQDVALAASFAWIVAVRARLARVDDHRPRTDRRPVAWIERAKERHCRNVEQRSEVRHAGVVSDDQLGMRENSCQLVEGESLQNLGMRQAYHRAQGGHGFLVGRSSRDGDRAAKLGEAVGEGRESLGRPALVTASGTGVQDDEGMRLTPWPTDRPILPPGEEPYCPVGGAEGEMRGRISKT